jgi:hypothetical protein
MKMPNDQVNAQLPVLSRHEGVWKGTFRRYDADGALMVEFPSTIVTRFFPANADGDVFWQTNQYDKPDGTQEILETRGRIQGDRLIFSAGRVEGWAIDDAADPKGRTCMLYLEYGFMPGAYVYESVQISDDGRYRCRATQFIRDGRIFQRTLIDEERVADDWQAWDAARDSQPAGAAR